MEKSIRSNPNPYDYEPYYNLGLSLKYQGKEKEAYDVFYKAIWVAASKHPDSMNWPVWMQKREDSQRLWSM